MITQDETIGATPRAKEKFGPKGRLQPWFCGHSVYTSEWASHDCPAKREALSPRKCTLDTCNEVFSPNRPGQKYHAPPCARKALIRGRTNKSNEHQSARKGLTIDEIHTLELRPITEQLNEAKRVAATYTPMMGEALYNMTMELMR